MAAEACFGWCAVRGLTAKPRHGRQAGATTKRWQATALQGGFAASTLDAPSPNDKKRHSIPERRFYRKAIERALLQQRDRRPGAFAAHLEQTGVRCGEDFDIAGFETGLADVHGLVGRLREHLFELLQRN